MNAIKKYFNSREINFNFLLGKPRRKYTPGTYHKLRVEIKKVKALFDLINFCSKDFKEKKTFRPFKQIFDQAGRIRELQLEEAMLKKYFADDKLSEYLSEIRKLRLKEQGTYFSTASPKMIASINNRFRKIVPFLSEIKNKKANDYLEKKTKSVRKIINKKILKAEQLHELRKLLKTLNYTRTILSIEKGNMQSLKKDMLPDLLGKWHDNQVIIRQLQKAIDTGHINLKELNHSNKIIAKISSENNKLFEKINNSLSQTDIF